MHRSQTLETSAKECKINLTTPFNSGHQFLKIAIEMRSDKPSGIVGADETYFRVSAKGNPVLVIAPSKPGTNTKTAGRNKQEGAPVLVAIARSFHEMDVIFNQVSEPAIKAKFKGIENSDSVLFTGGQKVYNPLCDEQCILHKVLLGPQVIDKVFHLNTVNA